MLGPEDAPTDIFTPSDETCRARCKAENTCNVWSWQKLSKMCYLFETKSEKELPGFTSGEKNCKGDTLASILFISYNVTYYFS